MMRGKEKGQQNGTAIAHHLVMNHDDRYYQFWVEAMMSSTAATLFISCKVCCLWTCNCNW
jgi:hypothetical protein